MRATNSASVANCASVSPGNPVISVVRRAASGKYSVKGHIAYYGPKHSVCIWFGDTPSLGACDLFALLDEKDIPRFAEEAQKVWDTRGEIIRVELCEEVGA